MSITGVWQNTLEFMCTWDLGRRCSLDCSYCPPHRHNNWSPHASLDDLKTAAQLPLQYQKIFKSFSSNPFLMNINFTGGEPTLNPHLFDICEFIRNQAPEYCIGVTTNGLFSEQYAAELSKAVDYITLSYHFEADQKAKKRIFQNIKLLHQIRHDSAFRLNNFSLNIMVHAWQEHFEECKVLVEDLKNSNIPFILRTIGEHPNDKGAHQYSQEQVRFIKSRGEINSEACVKESICNSPKKQSTQEIGRPCCGGRSFKSFEWSKKKCEEDFSSEWIQGQTSSDRVVNRNFKGWHCLVNLFFLHIEQESGDVFYHQTCQANLAGQRGPIGNLSNISEILDEFQKQVTSKTLKSILCPNDLCNCGLCITKSSEKEVLRTFIRQNLPGFEVQ